MNFIHTAFHAARPSPSTTLFRRTFFVSALRCQHSSSGTNDVGSYARTRRLWSNEDSEKLLHLVKTIGPKWTQISHELGRTPSIIYNRYKLLTDTVEFRGPWTQEELNRLRELTKGKNFDEIDWENVRVQMPRLRTVPILRLTYRHSIDPNIHHGYWSEEECDRLEQLVGIYGTENWDAVSSGIGTRTRRQCLERWRWQQQAGLKKGRFTAEEDAAILKAVKKYGENFALVKKAMGSERTARNISQHYRYALCPDTDRSEWTEQEENMVYDMCMKHNHDMSKVKEELGSRRNAKDMWNHYYKVQKKRIEKEKEEKEEKKGKKAKVKQETLEVVGSIQN